MTETSSSSAPLPLASEPSVRASVVRLAHQWFPVAQSHEVGRRTPHTIVLQGEQLVLFRDAQGQPHALYDRCPHRNVPLSLGKVNRSEGTLACSYHGWEFQGDGRCTHVPSLTGPIREACHARAYATREHQGLIWVYSTPGELPRRAPYRFEYVGRPGYTSVVQTLEAHGTLFSTLENALDVPHTAYLHRGLFRSKSRNIPITAKITRSADRVEVEYVGEPRPEGLVARVLSPSGGLVTHTDRFLLPSIAQVEYRIGEENHLFVDSVMTPVSDFVTRIYAVVSFRTRLPARLIKPLVKPLALQIFKQDAVILERQTATIRRTGGERFASTEVDVIGKHMWRLLRDAERGRSPEDATTHSEEVTLVL